MCYLWDGCRIIHSFHIVIVVSLFDFLLDDQGSIGRGGRGGFKANTKIYGQYGQYPCICKNYIWKKLKGKFDLTRVLRKMFLNAPK